jgi:uncharacterized protein
MKKSLNKRIFVLSVITLFVLALLYALFDSGDQSVYVKDLLMERQEKNRAFMISEESPLNPEDKRSFKGLPYFEPSLDWVFSAELKLLPNGGDTLEMTLNDGEKEQMIRVGELTFTKDGTKQTISCFRNPYAEDNRLFVPFRDASSGIESYGGGRYLDAINKGEAVILDFNRAYNPFCAYNDDFVCVIPPEENRIPLKILAGEQKPANQ